MSIFDNFKNMYEERPFLACFLLFFVGFLIGHVLCLAVYGIRFLVIAMDFFLRYAI